MHLPNNKALYDYLVWLAQQLRERGATELSAVVERASQQGASMNTEFLGEARAALRRVLNEEDGVLNERERSDLEDVVRQLTAAINRWPQSASGAGSD